VHEVADALRAFWESRHEREDEPAFASHDGPFLLRDHEGEGTADVWVHAEELLADALHFFWGAAGVGGADSADGGDEAGDFHLDGGDVCAFEEGDEQGEVGAGVGGRVLVFGEALADFADVLEGVDCELAGQGDGGELDLLECVEGPEAGHYVKEACSSNGFFVFEGQGEVFEETDGGVEELGIVGFGEDGYEGFVDLGRVDEFFAGCI